jgi:hypothetical protein
LFSKVGNYLRDDAKEVLGYIYSRALFMTGDRSDGFNLSANQWGFMYANNWTENKKTVDITGEHLLIAGKRALPYLRKLLDDSARLWYEGSEEATIGNAMHYRVKDAAAFFIGEITGVTVKYYEDDKERDKQIERLTKTM